MGAEILAMIATYDLSKDIASFEFFNWLVMVQAGGATEIVFNASNPKTRKFSYEQTITRFRTIIEPGPALAGLPYRLGRDPSNLKAIASQLLPWFKAGNQFTRLQSVKPPEIGRYKYTVTIRDNLTAKARNSSDAWYRFASEIGACILEDWRCDPVHLHDRMALYAGAKMNFGVCNGPIHLLSLTSYPVQMWVNTDSARNGQMRWGMQPGQKYPWMLPNQTMVWQEDNLDNLRRAFDGQS
jgi:hypothetical protein